MYTAMTLTAIRCGLAPRSPIRRLPPPGNSRRGHADTAFGTSYPEDLMKRITTAGLVVALVCVASFTSACSNTADGVKQDSKIATEKVGEATATAGAEMGAAMETMDVKAALIADTRVDAVGIDVDTNKDTKTVTLNGTVKTDAMRTLAGDVAKDKAPGYAIVNKLTIKK